MKQTADPKEDLERCDKCDRRVWGIDPEPHALNCGFILDEYLYGELKIEI